MVGLQAPDDLPQPPTAGRSAPTHPTTQQHRPPGRPKDTPRSCCQNSRQARVLIPPVRRLSVPVRGLHLPGARLSSVPVALCPPASSEAGRLCMGSRQGGLAGIRGGDSDESSRAAVVSALAREDSSGTSEVADRRLRWSTARDYSDVEI